MTSDHDTPETASRRPVGRFTILLIALVTLLGVAPFFAQEGGALWTTAWSALIFAGLLASTVRRNFFIVAIAFAIPSLILRWLEFEGVGFAVAAPLAQAAFIGFVVVLVVKQLLHAPEVDLDQILGAVNAFLLMGVFFEEIHVAIETLRPGSYIVAGVPVSESLTEATGGLSATMLYYSFTTLTTLGYGDIQPLSLAARIASTGEAIIGQLFVAILIASLVSAAARRKA